MFYPPGQPSCSILQFNLHVLSSSSTQDNLIYPTQT